MKTLQSSLEAEGPAAGTPTVRSVIPLALEMTLQDSKSRHLAVSLPLDVL
jgi:hypothetical protein